MVKNFIKGLTLVEEWEIKEGSEDEENFSYLEDI